MPPDLRVMTYNIRNSGAWDGRNAWRHRRSLWIGTVAAFDPDLLGVQEVLQDQFDDLKTSFPTHTAGGVGREDGNAQGERAMILFRSDRFEQSESGTFWLSETPEKIASTSWDTCLTRACSWVRLRDRSTGRPLVFANTHFDHVGMTARLKSAELLAKKLPQIAAGSAVVLTGDFNCTEIDPPYTALMGRTTGPVALAGSKTSRPVSLSLPDRAARSDAWITDSYRAVHREIASDEGSFHNFKGTSTGLRIDWIFNTPHLVPITATIDRTRGDAGRCPSDHDAVTATLRWTAAT